MKNPDEIELPEEYPGLHQAHPMALQLGMIENEQLMEAVYQGRTAVPPCTIDGEEVEIFSFDPNGEDQHFHAPRIADKIVTLISQGKKTFSLDVPGVTAQVIGNMLNPGRMYFIEQQWQQLLSQLLPKNIRERTGILLTCTVTVLNTKPLPTIHGEFVILNGEIPMA